MVDHLIYKLKRCFAVDLVRYLKVVFIIIIFNQHFSAHLRSERFIVVELVGVRNGLVVDLHENVLQHSPARSSVQSFEGSGSSLNVAEQVGDGLVVRVHDPPHVVVVLAVVVVH